jgi:threonine dehydrogenase-like Zn-dependent dehydrogenase
VVPTVRRPCPENCLKVYTAANRERESHKARIVRSVGGTYVNVKETPIDALEERFDIVIEATGRVDAALKALDTLGPNGVMCFLGIYVREKRARSSVRF